MILVFSWVSFILFLFILYSFLIEKTKEWATYILIAVFFSGFFFLIDVTFNSSWNSIDRIAPTVETCDITSISSQCTLTKDYSGLSKESKDMIALRERLTNIQIEIGSLLSVSFVGVLMLFFMYLIWKGAEKRGLIHA